MNAHLVRLLRVAAVRVGVTTVLLAGVAGPAAAQDPLWGWLKIRKSASDKNTVEKPASVLVQVPADAPTTVAADLGLAGNVLRTSTTWSLEPTVEWHKHTALDAPQDTLDAGATLSYLFGDPAKRGSYLDGSLTGKSDRVKDTSGVEADLGWVPLWPDAAIGAARGPAAFKVRWQPVFVLELENTTKAEGTTPTGSVTRSQLGADVSVFPWADKAGNRLELLLGGRLWSELGKAEALGPVDRLIPLGSVSLTGYFDSGRHVGVGLEVVTGSNPPEGLVDQRYLQLGLKVRY